MARNIDASLSSVEEILSALIDMSRMDAGSLEPEIVDVSLARNLPTHAGRVRAAGTRQGLASCASCRRRACVRTDRRLLRRLLQNLVSNAVKYTTRGRC